MLGYSSPKIIFLSKRLDSLEDKVHGLEKNNYTTVECDKCGCLLRKHTAIAGVSIIRKRDKKPLGNAYPGYSIADAFFCEQEEYIYTPYFCKIHAPLVVNG